MCPMFSYGEVLKTAAMSGCVICFPIGICRNSLNYCGVLAILGLSYEERNICLLL